MKRGLRSIIGRTLDAVDRGNHVRRLRDRWASSRRNGWLRSVKNLVHVGANSGQEAALYETYGLGVLWIEPNPVAFEKLTDHIKPYPRQAARKALVTDVAGRSYSFRVSSHDGVSSSILDFSGHRDIWQDVVFESSIDLVSETLDTILDEEARAYDAMVVNCQGAELLVMKGGMRHLSRLRFIQARLPDFDAYQGGTTIAETTQFLAAQGFVEYRRDFFASKPDGSGTYYDVVFTSATS